jgi:hypothetical protein
MGDIFGPNGSSVRLAITTTSDILPDNDFYVRMGGVKLAQEDEG